MGGESLGRVLPYKDIPWVVVLVLVLSVPKAVPCKDGLEGRQAIIVDGKGEICNVEGAIAHLDT
eukprot:scaffold777_cov159-Amphora_coffeaeformis.AAC.1